MTDLLPVTRTVRFRLALLFAGVLTVVAAILLVGLNLWLERSLAVEQPEFQLTLEDALVRILGLGDLLGISAAVVDTEALIRERTLENLRVASVAGLVALLPLSFGVGWLVAGRVLAPIGRITTVARDISVTDLSRRIRLEGPDDDLKRMADTFDGMLDRLDTGVRAQQTFIEDASHELRNPLAVIRTTLDVALADPDDAEGLRRAAETALRTTDRMTGTVDELLLYARHGLRPTSRAPVDLEALVTGVAGEYAAVAAARDVAVAASAPAGLVVEGDREALHRAAANLLSNAIRVAPAGSTVHVRAGRKPGWRWFGVRDLGPGIEPAKQPLVFRRSWREGRPGSPDEGRGIGLALVRQIAEAHGGTATVASAPGHGASFVVWLPAREDGPPRSVAELRDRADPLWAAGLPD
jgi:signal transduction histidine kinase